MRNLGEVVRRFWRVSPSLTAVGMLMLAVLAVSGWGLVFDPRLVGGVPLWLKPAKFAASTSLYAFSVAWVFTYLESWPRMRRVVGGAIAGVFVVEVALVILQAVRETTSHFNVATPLDGMIFAVMGLAILAATVAVIALAVATLRHRFDDAVLGWAIRLGLLISILGSGVGGLMTRPTEGQLAAARETRQLKVAGAHTVGAPDGGPGVPGTGWSRDHGDLRVPHFVGLHAMQVLPLLSLLIQRVPAARRRAAVFWASGSYLALFLILLGQALGGQSVTAPGGIPLLALAMWLVVSTIVTALMMSRHPREARTGRTNVEASS